MNPISITLWLLVIVRTLALLVVWKRTATYRKGDTIPAWLKVMETIELFLYIWALVTWRGM